jgi:hypothetical protein
VDHVEELPHWIEPALQGIAYWIGHRRCIWPHHPLPEAALVAEVCNLISAHLPDSLRLECEVTYKKLLTANPLLDTASELARADLVIFEKLGEDGAEKVPRFVIEVKRAGISGASKERIDDDLRRLSEARSKIDGLRAFLFVIAERKLPIRFITDEGTARLGVHKIEGCSGSFRVRRVLKAAHSFEKNEHAHYACAIEVFD